MPKKHSKKLLGVIIMMLLFVGVWSMSSKSIQWNEKRNSPASVVLGLGPLLKDTFSGSDKNTIHFAVVGDVFPQTLSYANKDVVLFPDEQYDFVLGNLEGVLSPKKDELNSRCVITCFEFVGDKSFGDFLYQNQFRIVNLANNHSYDFGAKGQSDTILTTQASKLLPIGIEGNETMNIQKNGYKIGFMGVSPFKSTISSLSKSVIDEQVKSLKTQGAEFIIAYVHSGTEGKNADHVPLGKEYFEGESRGDTRLMMKNLKDAGVDLVVGSGPHVLRGIESLDGVPIVYSLGNFYIAQAHVGKYGKFGDSMVLNVSINPENGKAEYEMVPYQIGNNGIPEKLEDKTGRQELINRVNHLSETDFPSSYFEIQDDGKLDEVVIKSD